MDFKVIFKQTFLEDLEPLVRSIAVHDPIAAHNLGKIIIQRGESLSVFPERYPKVRQRPAIRRYIVRKNFKVYYRIDYTSKAVEILRLWDARRETEPKF